MLFSVQTPAAGGTAFAQFAAAWCYDGNGYILNDTGTSIDVRIGASGSIQTLAAGGTLPIKLVYSMAELYVRRTDQATTQVTVEAQVGTGSAGGGGSTADMGVIASAAAAAAVAAHNDDAGAHGLLALGPRIRNCAVVGDSLSYNIQAAPYARTSSWFWSLDSLLGNTLSLVWADSTHPTFAVGGITPSGLLDGGYAAGAAASIADTVFVLAGTNALASQTPAQIAADIITIWDLQLAAGKAVVAVPILPRGNLCAEYTEVNRLLAAASLSRPRVIWCALAGQVVAAAAGDGTMAAEYTSGDGTHMNSLGDFRIASAIKASIAAFTGGNAPRVGSGLSLTPNRYMLGDTDGLADNLAIALPGGGTCVPTKVSAASDLGVGRYWQRFTANVTGQTIYGFPSVNVTAGRQYAVSMTVKMQAGAAVVAQVAVALKFVGESGLLTGTSCDANPNNLAVARYDTDPLVAPADALTAVCWIVLSGLVTADISDVYLYEV